MTLPPLISPIVGVRSPYLLDWRASDLTVSPRTGQTPAFSRAGRASYVDKRGRMQWAPHSMPRLTWVDAAGQTGLLVEGATTNYVQWSDALGQTARWTQGGSISVGSAIAGPGVDGWRLSDASASATGTVTQSVALGSGWHALSFLWRAGTSASSVVSLGTGIKASIEPGVGGAPVVTASAGRYLGSDRRADGWWRIMLASTASIGAATHTLTIAPANTIAGDVTRQGTADFGAVQVELAVAPTSYVLSTGNDVFGTRVADLLRYPLAWTPRDLTVYAAWARPAWAGIAGASGYRTVVSVGNERGMIYDASAGLIAAYSGADTGASSASVAYPAGDVGSVVSAAARIEGVASSLKASIDTSDGSTATGTATGYPLTSYPTAYVGLGSHAGGSAGYELQGVLFAVRIAAGSRALGRI